MAKKQRNSVVKCEGRFSELRNYLYDDIIPGVLDENAAIVSKEALDEIWLFSKDHIFEHDLKDTYFNNYNGFADKSRKSPSIEAISLLPLFPSSYHFENNLPFEYAKSRGNSDEISEKLALFPDQPQKFFLSNLQKDPGKIYLPNRKTFVGYKISANFGIGSISHVGLGGSGIRSDSPYLLEVYQMVDRGSGLNLAGVVGFWAQDNEMLVSQMQPSREGRMPEGTPFGVATTVIAEVAARSMGFEKISLYSAKAHPIFKEHPEDWAQLGKDFTCQWDGSARKLGYEPTNGRQGMYFKNLK